MGRCSHAEQRDINRNRPQNNSLNNFAPMAFQLPLDHYQFFRKVV